MPLSSNRYRHCGLFLFFGGERFVLLKFNDIILFFHFIILTQNATTTAATIIRKCLAREIYCLVGIKHNIDSRGDMKEKKKEHVE